MNNILLCSAGRRSTLIKYLRDSLKEKGKIVVTDCNNTAPALYFADKGYIVPKIYDSNYIDVILDICVKEHIKAITTLIDPETVVLSINKKLFDNHGILLLTPDEDSSKLCLDKYNMYEYLVQNNIKTIKTYNEFDIFVKDLENKEINFPVFVKPRFGSGSVGSMKVQTLNELNFLFNNTQEFIIQEYMDGIDISVDAYIDVFSKKVVSIFCKKKLETKIGGANKTISFRDNILNEFIERINSIFNFYGPIDLDLFLCNGEYYLSEINPRFGGSYLHAYNTNIDFIPLIIENINQNCNKPVFYDYEEDIVMMMHDDVIVCKKDSLL